MYNSYTILQSKMVKEGYTNVVQMCVTGRSIGVEGSG